MNTSTQVLLRFGEALSLYTTFGKNRDSFPDHYDEEKNIYIAECNSETKRRLEDGGSQEGLFLTEWTDKLLPGEKERRGLINIEGRNYFVYEECKDIGKSAHFTSFLAGVNFTDAVEETLTDVEDNAEQLFANLVQDGTYIVNLEFEGMANHAFLLLKEGNVVNLFHHHQTLISVTMLQEEFVNKFRTLYKDSSLISFLFGTELYFGARKLVKFNCLKFSPVYPSHSGVIGHLQCMAKTYFSGRPEYRHINKLIC